MEDEPLPDPTPQISVIVTSFNASRTIQKCMSSLEAQVTEHRFDVTLVDSSSDGTADLVEQMFPTVQVLRFKERKFCGSARNIGIAQATGRIIAFIDADCIAARDWIDRIALAHDGLDAAVAGTVANARPAGVVGWAAYFTEFSQWTPGTPGRLMIDAPGANMSYKKELFERLGGLIEGTYCSDTEFHWRMRRAGHQIRFCSDIIVSHQSIDRLGRFLTHEFHHGCCFARVRVASQAMRPGRRLLMVVLWPLIAVILFLRIVKRNLANRVYLAKFLLAGPLVAAGVIMWSCGEALGHLKGAISLVNEGATS